MFTRSILITLLILFSVGANSLVLAQGQLFSNEQADELFGPVENGIAMETSLISNLLETNSKLMFGIYNNRVVVLDGQRNVLFSEENYQVKSDDVFYAFSGSVIRTLLENGKNSITIAEKRETLISVTNGKITMELGSICPPYCD